MASSVYSLNNLPAGCFFYPDRMELLINCPIAVNGNVELLPTHMVVPSDRKAIFGRWKVCEDSLHVQNGETTKKIEDLIRVYFDTCVVMEKRAQKQREEYRGENLTEINGNKWGNLNGISLLALFVLIGVALSLSGIFLGIYF